ncbi:MAG: hypothetical protein WDM76_10385 [Limisphaerales bacterium]
MVAYVSGSAPPTFFRGRVWLEGEGLGVDANADGIPDHWQLIQTGKPADYASYVAGIDPGTPNETFHLSILKMTNGTIQVSFPALLAEGAGYEGRTRYYALETSTNLKSATWQAVANLSRIKATNQLQVYNAPLAPTNAPAFYRARVWIEGP